MTFRLPLPAYAPPDAAPAAQPAPAPEPAAPAPATAPAPTPSPAPTALERAGADAPADPVTPSDWPADWRDKLSGGDAKKLERLKRFTSPLDVGKSFFEADSKIRSGKAAEDVPMPEDAEAAKAWRKERGLPEDPTGYALPEAITKRLTDEDKPLLATFTQAAHKANLSPKAVEVAAAWYTDMVESQVAQQIAADKEAATATSDALRAEWGADFKANSTVAKRFGTEAIPGVDWFGARLPDGRALGNIPEVVKAFAELGMLKYGDVSFAGGEATKATLGRKEAIEKIMRTDFDAYQKDPSLAKELEAIYAAEEKRGGGRQ